MPQIPGPTEDVPIRLKRILFATDFSRTSAMALPYAAAFARRFGSFIYVTHVIPPEAYAHIPPGQLGTTIHRMKEDATQQIAGLLASSHFKDVPFQVILDHGDVMTMVSALVDKHSIDLIVAGSHGKHGIQKLLSPSVEEAIAGAAKCPVLLIGPEAAVEPEAEVHLSRILYATDFSRQSRRAMDYAYALAKAYAAKLLVMHVAENILREPLANRMTADAFIRKRLLESDLPENVQGVEPEFMVALGMPEERILQAAKQRDIQLIVVGVPGTSHPGLSSHLPGPLAWNLASHSLCPLLAIRSDAQQKKSVPAVRGFR
jgi:nucleotide-binding universal stress UspA family protein